MAAQYTKKTSLRKADRTTKSKEKVDLNELRNKFNKKLADVYTPATHEKAVVACHSLMREYAGDRQALRVIINCLTDKQLISASRGSNQATSIALHAAMFGVLSQVFMKDLVDPLDKPANRRRTYERIFTFFSGSLFSESSDTIYKGCGTSMTEILESTFPEMLEQNPMIEPTAHEDFIKVFLEPLWQILREKGKNKNMKLASCFCLRNIIEHLKEEHPHMLRE